MQNTLRSDIDLIERYFECDLTEEELRLLSHKLETEPIFKERLEQYEYIHNYVDKLFDDKVEKEELGIDNELRVQKIKQLESRQVKSGAKNFKKYLLAMAASVALLLAAFFGWQKMDSGLSVQQIAADYWVATDDKTTDLYRSEAGAEDFAAVMYKASMLYQGEDFREVHILLENVPDTYPDYFKVLMLQAKSFVGQGEYDKAIEKFQLIIEAPTKGGYDLALWYQGLAYIQIGEIEKGKENLEEIVRGQFPLADKAKEVLQNL